MRDRFSVDPAILRRGAEELTKTADNTAEAASTAKGADGSSGAFGASEGGKELAEAWSALVKARVAEMKSLAHETDQLAGTVREAADSYEWEDSDHSETIRRQEKALVGERERPRRESASRIAPGTSGD